MFQDTMQFSYFRMDTMRGGDSVGHFAKQFHVLCLCPCGTDEHDRDHTTSSTETQKGESRGAHLFSIPHRMQYLRRTTKAYEIMDMKRRRV